jgi:dihydroorotate dehydrogenase
MNSYVYEQILRPLLFNLDPEEAHNLVHGNLKKYGSLLGLFKPSSPSNLRSDFRSTVLANPVGLAAGFDKNGDLVHVLDNLGFGFAEVGSITAQAKSGNPKPRLFRLPTDEAVINRMGLNGQGAERVCEKLSTAKFSLPIGVNIAKTNDPSITGDAAIEDMITSFRFARKLPVMYISLNVSCPNAKGGVVSESEALSTLLAELQKENTDGIPLILKLSPDSQAQFLEEVVAAARAHGVYGFICGNTSTARDCLTAAGQGAADAIGAGGLSGKPIKSRALALCARVNELKDDSQIIVGCGGISSGADAYEFMSNGASFVQLYTALVYQGPGVVARINNELSRILQKEGAQAKWAHGAKQLALQTT